MKRIVLFINNLGSGGAQRQIVNIAKLLKDDGYDVEVLVYHDNPFYQPMLDAAKIPVTLLKCNGNAERILRVRKWLKKSGAAVVIAFLETPGFIACLSKIGHKRWKLITNERSAKMSTFQSRRNRFFNRFERFSDAKVGNSENAINMWRKYYPQYNDKYSVIYNPIMMSDQFSSASHTYLSNGRLHIVVAASYQELKNPIRVIEAVNLLSDEEKKKLDLHWYGRIEVTTGNTETFDRSKKMIEQYHLENCISLHPETDKIYECMTEGDVVGLFSTVEGLPNTICEAMMIGRPVLMSRVSDYDTLVSDNGYLCDPNSTESIRDAFQAVLSATAEELAVMGRSSIKKAQRLFSPDEIKKQWSELIENLTKE